MTRVIFMGTPDFAVAPLEALIGSGEFEVVLVVTQPDKAVGRKQIITACPVKQKALENQIEIFQPVNFKNSDDVDYLRKYDADVCVVAAYGNILPEAVLTMCRYGCINIHASLLPRYRGAAPIQYSILNGDEKTGVTIMKMDKGVDTGDIIAVEEIEIAADENAQTLFDKLSVVGSKLLMETLPKVVDGTAVYTKQDDAAATKVGMIKKTDAFVDFLESAVAVERKVRGYYGWPCAYTYLNGTNSVKLHKAAVSDMKIQGTPGSILCENGRIFVQCEEGTLELLTVQPEGKKSLSASECINGRMIKTGDHFGQKNNS